MGFVLMNSLNSESTVMRPHSRRPYSAVANSRNADRIHHSVTKTCRVVLSVVSQLHYTNSDYLSDRIGGNWDEKLVAYLIKDRKHDGLSCSIEGPASDAAIERRT